MILAKFDYVRPGSLDEAVTALAGGGDDAKVIAGGQSLLPLLRLPGRPTRNCWLTWVGLAELRGVTDAGDALVIGSRTTHYQSFMTRWSPSTAPCWCRPPPRWPTPRSGTAHDGRRARARRPSR